MRGGGGGEKVMEKEWEIEKEGKREGRGSQPAERASSQELDHSSGRMGTARQNVSPGFWGRGVSGRGRQEVRVSPGLGVSIRGHQRTRS